MGFISALLIKYGQTFGALAMAALLRYLEKTSLIQKYKKQISDAIAQAKQINDDVNNSNANK